ncbi:MAG: hypothetical protein Q4C72_05780 [Eubacteriales bacterium]|nr:hypothetical protein [Eubacteriales bacterium]
MITEKRQGVDTGHDQQIGVSASPVYAVRAAGEGWMQCSCRAWHKMELGKPYRVYVLFHTFVFFAQPLNEAENP